jgi:anti-sigma-K factor RskA
VEDLKAYIESGILELYVLGDITPDEKLQVEEMALKHPAVKAELDEIERSMELYAKNNAVEPPEHLRGRVLNSILTNFADDRSFDENASRRPVHNIVNLPERVVSINFYKYAFAACMALLLASTIALISLYNRLQQSNNQLAALQLDKQHFANQVSLMDEQLQVFRDPSFKLMKLKGTAHAPKAEMTIAWSPAKHKVMIDMGSMKMPANDSAHQYQLWAIVGKTPVDLGVFDMKTDSAIMKEMKSVASATAFAVTLEPRGGSAKPTMDEMMVIGSF